MPRKAASVVVLLILSTTLSLAVWAVTESRPAPALAITQSEQSPAPSGEEASNGQDIFFPWAFEAGGFAENWPVGLAHFVLGVAGALVTVYLFLGEFLPSMGGKAEYDLLKAEHADLKKRRDAAFADREKYARGESLLSQERVAALDALTDDMDRSIDQMAHRVSRERWRLFLLAFPMYVFLGGFFAAAFAVNALQAFIVGFGWTAVADRMGLQRELANKREMTEREVKTLESEGVQLARQVATLRAENEQLRLDTVNLRKVAAETTKQLLEAEAAARQSGDGGGK